jgi:hypothetical protein
MRCSCFSRSLLRVTLLLKRREGRYALVYLDRGGAGRGSDGRR